MEYEDFDLLVEHIAGLDYRVYLLRSPGGEANATMRFPFDILALENRLLLLENALLRSGGKRRLVLTEEERAVLEFGQALFDALFSGEVRTRYDVSLNHVRRQGKGMRVKLRIKDPWLSAIPWEFLFDHRRGEYLVLSSYTPLVRYLELQQPLEPLTVAPPLRILGVVANPTSLPALDVEVEKQRVERAVAELAAHGQAELVWVAGNGWRGLQRAMRRGPWHVFHFVGHGGFNKLNDEGYVVFADGHGEAQRLRATKLARLLGDHPSLRLVLLNSCDGGKAGQDIFSSTASILVRRGVPSVMAMQYEITDSAAIEFSQTFYETVVDGLPIETAITEARKAVSIGINNSLEWGTPVLFSHAPDGVLFSLSGEHSPPKVADGTDKAGNKPAASLDSEPTQSLPRTIAPSLTSRWVEPASEGRVLGIDLGTASSVMAAVVDGEVRIIPSGEGGNTVPSIVAFDQKGELLVGRAAKLQAAANPRNTIYSVMRLIGRHFDDPEVERVKKKAPYEIVAGPQDHARVQIPVVDRTLSPQEISAMILEKLKEDAEAYLGETVTASVIAVPTHFNVSQRQAIRDACEVSGLEASIIDECRAAALAYYADDKVDRSVLVCCLGESTSEVSILEVGRHTIDVVATREEMQLGGDNWSERIVKWMMDEFLSERNIYLDMDRRALQLLREAAEMAKIELSSLPETKIFVPFITADASGPMHLNLSLNRASFEQMTEDLVQSVRQLIEVALKDAGLKPKDLGAVILAGGATRMPMIQELVQDLTDIVPNMTINPEEVIAIGAAIQAGMLSGKLEDVLLDVTPLSLGVETTGGIMTTLIPRNTPIPTRKSVIFSTAQDNQTSIDINVLQGERTMAADNKVLGMFRLEDIRPAARGVPQIKVTFDIDANGILHVSAKDEGTGQKQDITRMATTGLSEEEMEHIVRMARQHEVEDKRRRDLIEARVTADQLIFTLEKKIREQGALISEGDKHRIEKLIGNLREEMEKGSIIKIRNFSEQLQQIAKKYMRLG